MFEDIHLLQLMAVRHDGNTDVFSAADHHLAVVDLWHSG